MKHKKILHTIRNQGHKILIAMPYTWLLIFLLCPLLIIFKISISESILGIPPYKSIFTWSDAWTVHLKIELENYVTLFQDKLYRFALVQSLQLASLSTIVCLLIGYPIAYFIARTKEAIQPFLLLLILLPFWTSFLLRVYAWIGLLSQNGVINNMLISLGLINSPLPLIGNMFSITLGMVYCYLPFMILPLYANLSKFDASLLEAAADLGCPPWKSFLKITLPLSLQGIIAGCTLVFIPCVGEFVIPEILGGPENFVLGKAIWTEFFSNRDWPMAATIAVCLIIFMVLPITAIKKFHHGEST